MPFSFSFLGQRYSRVHVQPDGYLAFSRVLLPRVDDPLDLVDNLPGTGTPNHQIAFFWSDLAEAEIWWAVEGETPNRIFHVEVRDFTLRDPVDPSERGHVLMSFHESEPRFDVAYGGELSASNIAMKGVAGWEASGDPSDAHGFFSTCTISKSCNAGTFDGNLSGNVFTVEEAVGPELRVDAFEPTAGALPGETFTATLTLENLGRETARGLDFEVWLSSDGVASPSRDRLLASVDDALDLASGTSSFTLDLDLPPDVAADRRYHVWIYLDPRNEHDEILEEDNVFVTDAPNFGTGVDIELTACEITTPSGTVYPGGPLSFETVIENRGVFFTGETEVQVWASSDRALDMNRDFPLATIRTPALPRADSTRLSLSGEASRDPIPPGGYFPICIADPNDVFMELGGAENNVFIGRPRDRFRMTAPPLVFPTTRLPDAVLGAPYEHEVAVEGGSFSSRDELDFSARGLPDGLSMSSTGVIRGRAQVLTPVGGAVVDVRVREGVDESAGRLLLRVVEPNPLDLDMAALPEGEIGVDYEARAMATGAVSEVEYGLVDGRLPPGVVISADGQISGVPTDFGRYAFRVVAREVVAGTPRSVQTEAEIVIRGEPLAISTDSLPSGVVGTPYSAAVRTTGAVLPVSWTLQRGSRLPDGLALQSSPSPDARVVIGGVPEFVQNRTFDLTATDAVGRSVSARFSIETTEPESSEQPPPEPAEATGGCSANAASALAPGLLLIGCLVVGRRMRRAEPRQPRST